MKRTRIYMILGMALLLSISLFVSNGQTAEKDIISFISITGGDRLIYLMNTRGEMLRKPFVIGPIRLYGLTWAPDGRAFAYYLRQNGNTDVYVMDVSTNEHRQLTFDGSRDYLPAWSPNGKWIAFVSERAGDMDIYRMDANGKNVKQLTDMGTCGRPAWSPDSQSIAFTSLRFLFLMDTEGKRLKRLVAADAFAHCTWSPDGKQILFSANVGGWKEELFSIEVNGGDRQQLTWFDQPASISEPIWSPSGKWIVYRFKEILKVEPVIGPGNFDLPVIYVIDTAGDGLTEPLESTKRLAAYSLGWAPEGFLSVSPSVEKQTTLWGRLKQVENTTK